MLLCNLVSVYQHFKGTYHPSPSDSGFNPEHMEVICYSKTEGRKEDHYRAKELIWNRHTQKIHMSLQTTKAHRSKGRPFKIGLQSQNSFEPNSWRTEENEDKSIVKQLLCITKVVNDIKLISEVFIVVKIWMAVSFLTYEAM
jgi:hypothetical protein